MFASNGSAKIGHHWISIKEAYRIYIIDRLICEYIVNECQQRGICSNVLIVLEASAAAGDLDW